jgi:iron(III) transport system permease protein
LVFRPSFFSIATALLAALILLLMAWPLAALGLSLLDMQAGSQAWAQLREMASTVLPGYARTTFWLCALVALWVAVIGSTAAVLIALFDFKGRRYLEWMLLLPLAMPAYVCAYAYTDFLQYSGPAQSWLRHAFDWQGRVLPEVRSLGGAVVLMSFTLYPYVYLLARTALLERSASLLQAAHMLGAGTWRRVTQIALPMARPAIMAGVSLALMETLADYGVVSYFGIQSFTAGIYKAWLVLDSPELAALLSLALLVFVAVVLGIERRMRRRMRFAASSNASRHPAVRQRLQGWRAVLAFVLCAMPVLLGFVLPVLMMLRPLLHGLLTGDYTGGAGSDEWAEPGYNWQQFLHWGANSLQLASMGAVLAVAVALLLAFLQRSSDKRVVKSSVYLASMGYAVPGAVLVVGLLLPWMLLAKIRPEWNFASVLTTTVLGLMWAYVVRFCAAALQSLQSGYTRLPASGDEAARLLGQSRWRLFSRVHFPLLRGSLLTALLLVFVDVMKELPATIVLRPFDFDTLAVMAWQLARDERLAEAAIPSLTLVGFGLLPVILLSRSVAKEQHTSI